ncbi:MAG: NUDIX domain-containing protein [Actinomycetota bacterium]
MNKPNLRQAVRAFLIDPADRLLLMAVAVDGWRGWVLPGGGIEDGEDHDAALRRELTEETGVPEIFIGPKVCEVTFFGDMGHYDGQTNHIYLVPCHAFDANPTMTTEELAEEGVVGLRWWTVAEMTETTDDLRPAGLAELTTEVLEYGAPDAPLVITEWPSS